MDYFNDLEWIGHSHRPICRAWVDKVFPDYWVLDYNHAGDIPLRLDDDPEIRLQGPVAWFTFPGPRTRFGSLTHSWNHSFVAFRGNRLQKYLETGLISFEPSHPVITISDPQRFLRSMVALVDYLDSPTHEHGRSVLMFEEILLQLHEQSKTIYPTHPSAEKIRNLIDQIGHEPEHHYDFRALAVEQNLSYTHFRRIFTQLAGYSPKQLVIRRRIAKACQMLRDGQEMKAIADGLGYSDVYHFSKQFKQVMGIPPGRYRAQMPL